MRTMPQERRQHYEERLKEACEEVNVMYVPPNKDIYRKKRMYREIAKKRAVILVKARLRHQIKQSPKLNKVLQQMRQSSKLIKILTELKKLHQSKKLILQN